MNKIKLNKQTKSLFEAILSLKDATEAEAFFRDLCTIEEIKEMSDRWEIVSLLKQEKPYREIAKKAKVSTTTVSRVAAWLNYGAGGYETIYNRLNHHPKRSAKKGLG